MQKSIAQSHVDNILGALQEIAAEERCHTVKRTTTFYIVHHPKGIGAYCCVPSISAVGNIVQESLSLVHSIEKSRLFRGHVMEKEKRTKKSNIES